MGADRNGYFWNASGGDRAYNADSYEKWLKRFFTTGVMFGECGVSAGSGMTVAMAPGYVNINGKVGVFDNPETFTLDTGDSTSPRIDTIVIERNDNTRMITAKVVKGTPAASPQPVAPVRIGGVYQLVVAQVYVSAAASEITNANITDKRVDSSVCGLIQSTVNNFAYGPDPLAEGVSNLATGTFYFQYE